jgi:hypothetical protein
MRGAPKKLPVPPQNYGIGTIVFCLIVGGLFLWKCSHDDRKSDVEQAPVKCANDDLQCRGNKAVVAAGIYCKAPIERLAKHSVRWTEGTFEIKFSHFQWVDKAASQLTVIGDKVESQNGFGAYSPMIYECDLGSDGKTVLDVRVSEGRLSK